ncbi:hypothetical protein P7F88_22775 [Vibrio hannami]|uniref:hypothetical protein n=1 Tax=Vibrio hannami TaxID=2717094 RepID=UPI00241031DC|nr:hypothetical protein [Vibrio hannami]MDG3088729.1 hypothetical protein [Vibrio hannami]
MQKVLTVLSTVLFVGCTTLDSDSNFDDAIAAVNTKHNYKQIVAKPLSPVVETLFGANLVDSKLTLVGNYSQTHTNIPSSYVKLDVTTFKSYTNYSTVKYKEGVVSVEEYAPTAETCSDNCTTTQFLKFPVDNSVLTEVGEDGLNFELNNANNTARYNFHIPGGYINAVTELFDHGAGQPVVTTVAEKESKSKPIDMVEYWYHEASSESQSRFTSWAFENRASISLPFSATNKPEEMMEYWFGKASVDERKTILSWLVVQ